MAYRGSGSPSGPQKRRGRRKKPVKVAVPYAPTPTGKAAEEEDRRERRGRRQVSVPYAPTPKGKAAEREDKRERRAKRRSSSQTAKAEVRKSRRGRRRAKRRLREIESDALQILRDSGSGPKGEKRRGRRKQAELKPADRSGDGGDRGDAIEKAVDLQVIKPAKDANVLPKERLPGGGSSLDRAGQALEFAATVAPIPATKALKVGRTAARVAEGVKGAGKAAEEAKAVKSAPRLARRIERAGERGKGTLQRERARQRRNLASHESNRAAQRASRRIRPKARNRAKLKARRKARDFGTRHGREGRKVARRTRAMRVGLMTPQLTGTAAGVGGLGALGAAVSGHIEAIKNNPGGVTARTLEIAPGLVISTADLAAQAAQAAGTGNTAGLRKRIAEDASFTADLVKVMASGDEERVKEFVEENGLIAPLMLVPGAMRLGRTRIKQTAGDLAPERATRATRRRAHRKQSAKDASREEAEAMADVKAAGEPIVESYLGKGRRKGVRGRRKLRRKDVDAGDLVAMAVEEGLTPSSAARVFPEVARKWDQRPRFTDKREGGVTGHDLADFVRENPGVFDDPAFWRTVDAYRRQEPTVRRSEDVVDVEQAKTHGVQLPEDRTPLATRDLVPDAASREDVATYIGKSGEGGQRVRRLRETIRAAEGRAREMRAELRQIEKQERARQRRASGKAEPLAVMQRRRQQLLDVEADIRGMRAELAQTQRRHSDIAAALRDPDQAAAVKREFDDELAAVRSDKGLERGAYVPHTDVGREGIPVAQPVTYAGKKLHTRSRGEDSLAERGRVDYSLGSIIEAGVQAPRIRRNVHNYVNSQMQEHGRYVPVATPGGRVESRRLVTREEAERGLTPDEKRDVVLFPLNQWKQAVMDHDVDGMTSLVDDLAREVDWRAEDKGHKYVVLDKDIAAEIKAQVSAPGRGLSILQTLNRGLSRIILASPAWAAAQVIAEGLQAAVAINPLNPANIYHLAQGYRGLRDMDPVKAREFRADHGAMPGMGATPKEWFTADGRTQKGLAANFRRAERVMPIKRLIQALRLDWLRAIDRKKGGEYRVAVAVTRAHKEAMGLGVNLRRLIRGERRMSERLARMSPAERIEWATRSTPAKRRLENYLDDVMGNWRALSRKEKVAAPALIFYPFLRMSLQWPFYSFPKRHPIRAAVMYDLAASHNAQLRALLGGPPSWFSEYATAIVYGNNPDEATLTRATRIVPGANAIFEAVVRGGDIAAQRTLNPVVGYFNALVNGIDPMSGEQLFADHMSAEEKLIARMGLALSLLFNTAPPVRALDQLSGPKEDTALPIVGARRKKDPLGELLEDLNGAPLEQFSQTLFNPLPSEDLGQARDKAIMGRIFEIWRTAGSDAQDAVINDDDLGEGEKERRLAKMRAASDEADAELHRLYEKHDIDFAAREEAESERYFDLKYPDEDEGTGNKYLDGAAESSGNKYLEASGTSRENKYLTGAK